MGGMNYNLCFIMIERKTKVVRIGSINIGGSYPVAVQTMTKTSTTDIKATVKQIRRVEELGSQMVRVAVQDEMAVKAFKKIKKEVNIPLIADIHFDYILAIKSIEAGADKIRINPGNIGDRKKLKEILKEAKEKDIAIRIGINSGSLEKSMLKKYGQATVEAMVESALNTVKYFEDNEFNNIIISLKANDVKRTVEAYRMISHKINYPLHLGITEAGTVFSGTIKSAIGMGILLYEGIGDTIRVSLSAEPEEEVRVAYEILKALEIYSEMPVIIACPTCSRAEIDVVSIAKEIEDKIADIKKDIRIAVMGCVVNGPGEAIESDIGITGTKDKAVIFKKGKVSKNIPKSKIVEILLDEIKKL